MDDGRDRDVDLRHSRELLPTIARPLRWRGLQEWLFSSLGFAAGYLSRQVCVACIPGEVVQEGTYAGGQTRSRKDEPVYNSATSGTQLTLA